LIFSMSSEKIYAKRFLNAGAKGFLSKDSTFDETKKAILLILNNKRYISDSLAHALVEDTSRKMTDNPFNKLSKREFEITNLMLAGHTLTNICKSLGLSLSSVGTFKSRIFKKLGTKNLIELSELARIYDLSNKA
jgi:two-component system, NarL family, invasion response regulator UvrY